MTVCGTLDLFTRLRLLVLGYGCGCTIVDTTDGEVHDLSLLIAVKYWSNTTILKGYTLNLTTYTNRAIDLVFIFYLNPLLQISN